MQILHKLFFHVGYLPSYPMIETIEHIYQCRIQCWCAPTSIKCAVLIVRFLVRSYSMTEVHVHKVSRRIESTQNNYKAKMKIKHSVQASMLPRADINWVRKQHLQMGERTMTTPIGYRKKVVLSRKGNTASKKIINLYVNPLRKFGVILIIKLCYPLMVWNLNVLENNLNAQVSIFWNFIIKRTIKFLISVNSTL